MAHILRFEGLPFRISDDDLFDWIEELTQISPKEIYMISNRQGLASGDAYVVLDDKTMGKGVVEKCDEKTIRGSNRYVKIHECAQDELDWQLHRQSLYQDPSSTELYCVRMYGLPFRVSEFQVAEWFEEGCVDVQFHLNHQGRKSGDATAFFTSEKEAKKALEKDKQDMSGRYINLSLDKARATFGNAQESSEGQDLTKCLRMSGLPFRATEKEMKDFFLPDTECVSIRVILNRDGRPSGDAIATFKTNEDVTEALKKDREHLGSRFIILSRCEESGSHSQSSNNAGAGRGGFCIKMSGLPFRTTVPEIIDFFSTHADCTKARILNNRDNRPSGKAIAEFASKEEVLNAMKLNKEYIGDRFVVLTPMDF